MTRTLKTAVLATGMVALMAGVAQADHIPDGRKVEIKLVTYGPGINMFRKGKSNVLERLDSLKKANGKALDYTVCSNTTRGMKVEKSEIVEFVHDLYPGIVRILELQEKGYVYIRP